MSENSYINISSLSDVSIIQMMGEFILHHRLNQNRTQQELSKSAGVSRSTLSLVERGEKISLSSLLSLLRALDQLQVLEVFKVSSEVSPIAYAKLIKESRKRASGSDSASGEVGEDGFEEW